MLTKTVRSRFSHEIGEKVEGCTIVERREVIPPNIEEKRRGVYEYVVEVPPAAAKPRPSRQAASSSRSSATASGSSTVASADESSFTRASPEDMPGGLIRRLPPR